MKKILMLIAVVTLSLSCIADDKPVTYEILPAAAKEFIKANFPDEKVSYAFADDDLIRPDYMVRLADGTEIQFNHDGSLEKVSSRAGVPSQIIPVQITEYVKTNFPDAVIVDYEIGRREYEIGLSNGLDLKFNNNFRLVEMDD